MVPAKSKVKLVIMRSIACFDTVLTHLRMMRACGLAITSGGESIESIASPMMADSERPDAPQFDPKPDRQFKGKELFDENGSFVKYWRKLFPSPEARRAEVLLSRCIEQARV